MYGIPVADGNRGVDQIGAVDAEEAVAQEVFPLGDAGFVAEGFAGGCDDADLGVVGLHVGEPRMLQRMRRKYS